MKKITFLLSAVLVFAMLCGVLGGCERQQNDTPNVSYVEPDMINTLPSGVIAQNGIYSLEWDGDRYCVLLRDIAQDIVWSATPYDFYSLPETEGLAKVRMESPFFLEYIDNSQIKESYGFVEACMNGKVASEAVENGLRVTYYCTDIQFAIPVEYRLFNGGLEVRLIVEDILEGPNPLYSVSVAPYMCAAKANTDSYLFVPSGSGALMSVDEGGRSMREFSGLVYGEDINKTKHNQITYEEPVYLPVYGVKYGAQALTAIIDEGASLAKIYAKAGDTDIGYANIQTTFYVRGSDIALVTAASGYKKSIVKYTDDLVDIPYTSVLFYPQMDDKANYAGMAETYREYLKEKYDITSNNTPNAHTITILGAAITQKNILGVKYDALAPLTTLEEATAIITDLQSASDAPLSVQLKGFGKNGTGMGIIAGGYEFASVLGGKAQLDSLLQLCNGKQLDLFMTYDVLFFSKNGKGVNKSASAVTTTSGVRAQLKYYLPTTFTAQKGTTYYALKHSLISGVADKTISNVKSNGIGGVALNTLGNKTYSDYESASTYAKNNFDKLAATQLSKAKENGLLLGLEDPNAYAAVLSDRILGSPTISSQNLGFERDVPFYQMVFKGLIPTAVSPINYGVEPRLTFLTAMETGCSLNFTVAQDTDGTYSSVGDQKILFSSYAALKEDMVAMFSESAAYLNSVSDATVTQHEQVAADVYRTVFSNGITAYINKSDTAYTSPLGTVQALGFLYGTEEGGEE